MPKPRTKPRYLWERPPKNRAVGELEQLAYKRHHRDLATGHKRGLWFDDAAAERAVQFVEGYCRHSKGRWAGEPFRLELWQQFVVRVLFGWKRADGRRRFRYLYLQVARKNGKTTLAAAIALYLLAADKEAGAEVYSFATKRDQSKICFDEAARMVRRSDALSKYLDVYGGRPQSRVNNISCELLGAKFEPMSADDESHDGLNIHGAVCDELHKWKRRELWDVITTGTGARENPLVAAITTPGVGEEGICFEQRDFSVKVLEQTVEDDEHFAYICEPAKDADFQERATWEMGNPNIDVSVRAEDLAKECERAVEQTTLQNAFRRYRCGQWTEQVDRWLDMRIWKECGGTFDRAILAGRPCYPGLDLSSTTDLSALVLWFPPYEDDHFHRLLPFAWLPEDRISVLARETRAPYRRWADEGYLELTPGDVIDYDFIRRRYNELGEVYDLVEGGFDPWNATSLINDLTEKDGHRLVKVPQGTGGMSAPCKEFERLFLERTLRHGDHPVLTWCASNIAIWTDANNNIKPSRKSSGGRIDIVVASIVALARAMYHGDAASIYETRGLA